VVPITIQTQVSHGAHACEACTCLQDVDTADIAPYFHKTYEFVEEARTKNQGKGDAAVSLAALWVCWMGSNHIVALEAWLSGH